jgi:hypothetical protein
MTPPKTFMWSGLGQAPLEVGDWVRVLETGELYEEFPAGTYGRITDITPGCPGFSPVYFMQHLNSDFQYPFEREDLFGPLQQHEIPASLRDED